MKISKHYVYRLDYDTGFAPNVEHNICTLSGCKKTTIERWAKKGSWIIGIGGNRTGKPDKLIYAMEVEENLPYFEFREKYPAKSEYLKPEDAGTNVLFSTKFYYFGKNALELSEELRKSIIWRRHGCKCLTDLYVAKLKTYIEKCGYKNYGVFGEPCNRKSSSNNKKC